MHGLSTTVTATFYLEPAHERPSRDPCDVHISVGLINLISYTNHDYVNKNGHMCKHYSPVESSYSCCN